MCSARIWYSSRSVSMKRYAALILIDPVQVRNGLAYPSDRPGTGLEWNESLIRHLAA